MEWYSKDSVWDPLMRDQPNVGEAPVEKSVSSVAETEMSNSKSSSSSSSSKRKRVYHKSLEKMKCSVDGCDIDLGTCREYHRRHRVCQPHSKTSCVLVKGQEQRFCQQCSRFQSLDEFDGFKRSCRRRLEGHNKRRRKPRPHLPLAFSADYKGSRILQFGNPTSDDRYTSMWSAQPGGSYNRYPPILPKIEIEQQSVEGRAFGNTEYWSNNEPVPTLAEAGIGDKNQKMMPSDSALYLLSALQAQSSSEFSMVESSIDCTIQSQPPFEDDGRTLNCSYSRRLGVEPKETEFEHNGMIQTEPQLIEHGGGSLKFPFFWE